MISSMTGSTSRGDVGTASTGLSVVIPVVTLIDALLTADTKIESLHLECDPRHKPSLSYCYHTIKVKSIVNCNIRKGIDIINKT